MIKTAVRKNSSVEFIQYTGSNIEEIDNWMEKKHREDDISSNFMLQLGRSTQIYIDTVLGYLPIGVGDYVIKHEDVFYLWRKDMFEEKYEEVKHPDNPSEV